MTELERPLSSLSISSSAKSLDLDWDNQSSPASANSAPVTPSPRRRRVELPNVDGTPTPLTRLSNVTLNVGGRRPLADLVRIRHDGDKASAEDDEHHHLTQDEERRLREALDNWVNSADDDLSFHARDDSVGSESPLQSRTRSSTVGVDSISESSNSSSAERQHYDETKESGHA